MSWVDHVLTTASVDELVCNFSVLNDVIVSNNKPVSFCLKCDVASSIVTDTNSDKYTAMWTPNWQQCDEFTLVNSSSSCSFIEGCHTQPNI